jgi:hypothetical protein
MSFSVDEFVASVPRPDDIQEAAYRPVVSAVFDRIRRRAGNAGLTDSHRALNFASLRYPALYEIAARAAGRSMMLMGVESNASVTPDGRRLVSIRMSFRSRTSDLIERYRCRIDTTEVFPFLASPMQQVFDV